jgi:hypothetical protein
VLSQGFLSFLGLGVTETKTLSTKVTSSGSNESRRGHSAVATVHLHSQVDELYDVAVFYDTVFGTFAFQRVDHGPAKVSGVARDVHGKSLAGEIVARIRIVQRTSWPWHGVRRRRPHEF